MSKNMTFKTLPLTKSNSKEWDDFCEKSPSAWFWHTSNFIDYILHYQPQRNTRDLSFFVRSGDGLIKAIVPLTIEDCEFDGKKASEFLFGGQPLPLPVFSEDLYTEVNREKREKLLMFILSEIDNLAKIHKVARITLRNCVLASAAAENSKQFNSLFNFGFINISLKTQVIDLKKSEDELSVDLRRNHTRNIKKGNEHDFKLVVYTSENINHEVFLAYKTTHKKAAGRQTRPDYTFDLMYEWITKDRAFLAVVLMKEKQIGFEYYSVYKNRAVGFSAANDPAYEHLPIRHFLEWNAMIWMKKQGIEIYEIGLQQYGPLLYDIPDEKLLTISHFKKGFGGFATELLIGEKFYDREYFLHIYNERIKKYAKAIWQN